MPHSRIKGWLEDVRLAAEAIRRFVEGRTIEEYESDLMFRSAVERQFMIIGEAFSRIRHVDESIDDHITDLPKIMAFRNIVVHGYDVLDNETVFQIATTKLSQLITEVEGLIREY